MPRSIGIAALVLIASIAVVAQTPGDVRQWDVPRGFPTPRAPADNPITPAKIELGRHLFYDTRLSGNGSQSCASCHEQARAFTDGRGRSVGSTGQVHPRGSMSLVNVAFATALNWGTPHATSLEFQALGPMFGTSPIELGLDERDEWLSRLNGDATYARLVRAAYPGEPSMLTRTVVVNALATFQRAIVSARSPWDRYHFDRDDTAIPEAAKRGEVLFHSRPLSCFTCHGGPHFSNAMGRGGRTMAMDDNATFKAPTLRNIAVTAPYMHDGSAPTLDAVIDLYSTGIRTRPFTLTADQRRDLLAFFESLTDTAVLTDPRYGNPWGR